MASNSLGAPWKSQLQTKARKVRPMEQCAIPPKDPLRTRRVQILGAVAVLTGDVGSRGRGTGLELAIAREIITGNGGTLTCESRPGAGTIFRFTWPAWVEEMAAVPTPIGNGTPAARPIAG
jgi:hypothetical protein